MDSTADVVTEALNAGTDTVQSSVNYTLGAHLENLTLTGLATLAAGNELANILVANGSSDSLSGGAGDDTLTGGMGNDTLDGGTGNDSMAGGMGNDTYTVDSTADVVTEALNAGTDTVQSSVNYTLGVHLENLTLTGTAITGAGNELNNVLIANNSGDSLSGGAGDDTLTGGMGNDTLDGGTGNDSMAGGMGNDTYTVDSTADVVTEALNAGTDTVQSSVNCTLGANLENLTLKGSATYGTGNNLDNTIIGNNAGDMLDGGLGNDRIAGGTGNDTLIGGAGSDALTGGGGTDTASYSASSVAVSVSLATGLGSGGDASGDSLSGITNLIGSSGADTLTGDAGNNYLTGNGGNDILSGGDGNDTLDGGTGNDSMAGGMGNDTYTVDSTADVVTEALNAGTDTVQSSVNCTLGANLENLTLTGTAATSGTGNALNNIIIGSNNASTLSGMDGNDIITGGTGSDTLVGGLGNDSLDGGNGSDWVDYSAATNNMTVNLKVTGTSSVAFFIGAVDQGTDTLSNIENVKTGSGNDNISVAGTSGIVNTVYAGAGDDTVIGGVGINTLYGEAGNDKLTGGTGNDTIFGGAGNDNITGAGGADSLVAGDGVDTLTGGTGGDTFDLATANTSLAGDVAKGNGGGDTFIINAVDMASTSNLSGASIQGTVGNAVGQVDTLQIKGTTGASIDLRTLIGHATGIDKIDLATDNVSSSVSLDSATIKSLVGLTGVNCVLTLVLGSTDAQPYVISESGVYTTPLRDSVTFYSDSGKTVQIAQVQYI